MAKVDASAAIAELPLNDDRVPEVKKQNRHVAIALNHMRVRMTQLVEKRAVLDSEIEGLSIAIESLE